MVRHVHWNRNVPSLTRWSVRSAPASVVSAGWQWADHYARDGLGRLGDRMLKWLRKKWRDIWDKDRRKSIPVDDMLMRTYRFLRLAMAMMALAILVSMVFERFRAPGWELSISAYYYTAARPIFTGGMIAIGGFLIAVKGRTNIEDVSLNLAGMMALLVPLIPPHQASPTTGSVISRVGFSVSEPQHHELLVNNLWTVVIIAVVSFGLMFGIGSAKNKPVQLQQHDKVGLAIAAGVAVLGIVLYVTVDAVRNNAHGLAASLMFVFLWPAIVANAYSAKEPKYRAWYAAIAISMLAFAAAVLIGSLLVSSWRHQVLVLEILELTPFLVYWIVQTIEQWDVGVEPARAT